MPIAGRIVSPSMPRWTKWHSLSGSRKPCARNKSTTISSSVWPCSTRTLWPALSWSRLSSPSWASSPTCTDGSRTTWRTSQWTACSSRTTLTWSARARVAVSTCQPATTTRSRSTTFLVSSTVQAIEILAPTHSQSVPGRRSCVNR